MEPEKQEAEGDQEQSHDLPGVVAEFGELKDGAILFEEGLARLLHRHPVSIKRAVERGELPQPCRLLGRNAWTVGAVLHFLEERQGQAAKKKGELERKIAKLSS